MRVVRLLPVLCAVPAVLSAQAPAIARAVSSITPQDIQKRIEIIADDSMRGRNTPSPELDEVANYIAGEFAHFGLAPGGDDGSYLQRYPIDQVRVDTARSVIAVIGGPTWKIGRDAVVLFGETDSPVSGAVTVVDGGNGGVAAVEQADLAGRIVVVVVPPPPASGPLLNAVFAKQASAIILSQTNRPDVIWNPMLARQGRTVTTRVGGASQGGGGITLELREPTIAPVLRRAGYDVAGVRADPNRPTTVTPLPDLEMRVDVQQEVVESRSAPNVVGVLPGHDPALKDEYVVFSAHMDHLGVGTPVNGDSIYNGADDDASGTVGVVELAEAFSRLDPAPRRSLIFLTVSGEEKGLWGSNWFTSHSPVPIGHIVADLNADMIGRNWRDTIAVIGKEHSDLGATLARVDSAHPELQMAAIDDIWPQEGFYTRSDHYNFARRGVPILFFFNGTHADYHRPSDEPAKIEAEKESRIVKLIFYLGLEVANTSQRPRWDPESYKKIVTEEP